MSEYADDLGNRFLRFDTGKHKRLSIHYRGKVDCDFETRPTARIAATPVAALEDRAIPYLFPSRYCQSDRLGRLAWDLFGKIEKPHDKVVAITEWIYENVEYVRGSTNSETSAYDTVTQRVWRVPRFRASRHRVVPRSKHSCALFHGLCVRARPAGLPRVLRVLHRRRAG